MVNIGHVNRFFWLRVPFFPIVALSYLSQNLKTVRLSKKYVSGAEEMSEEVRYEKFLTLLWRKQFLSNLSFYFYFCKKIPEKQLIFVVNNNLDWQSSFILRYLIKEHKHPHPRVLFNNIFINKSSKIPIYWDLIDTFYGESDLDRAINSKRSFLIEKSFLDRHPSALKKIKNSYIPIIPVYFFKDKKFKFWYVFGELIRTSNMNRFRSDALPNILHVSFEKLDRSIPDIVESYAKNKKLKLRGLFRI